jgi:hypothetical protein
MAVTSGKPAMGSPVSTEQALVKSGQVQKQMIYNAQIRLTVKDYKQVRGELEQIAAKRGAYLVNSSESRSPERFSVSLTYRVPENEFSAMVKECGKLNALIPPETDIQSTDVSEEMVDLESRLKAKQATEARLMEMMKKATTPKDLLEISREIDSVQSEIEQIKGRIRYLSHHVSYSTVQVQIEQPVVSPSSEEQPLGQQMVTAFKASVAGIGATLQRFLIFLAAAVPVIIVLMIPGVPVYLFLRRKK